MAVSRDFHGVLFYSGSLDWLAGRRGPIEVKQLANAGVIGEGTLRHGHEPKGSGSEFFRYESYRRLCRSLTGGGAWLNHEGESIFAWSQVLMNRPGIQQRERGCATNRNAVYERLG